MGRATSRSRSARWRRRTTRGAAKPELSSYGTGCRLTPQVELQVKYHHCGEAASTDRLAARTYDVPNEVHAPNMMAATSTKHPDAVLRNRSAQALARHSYARRRRHDHAGGGAQERPSG